MSTKSEDQILRSRLTVEDKPLKRCLRQLSTMCARHSRLSPEEARLACERVLQEVRWFRHTVQVAVQSQRRCEQEIRSYSEQCAGLDRGVADSHLEIKRLGDRLEESRNHKRHKVAYDEIAAEANNRPTRERLLRDFNDLNSEIEQLRQEEASHEVVVGALRAQYLVVIGELGKLAETSKNALSMQDLGIYLGDADADADTDTDVAGDEDCEKTTTVGPAMGISPTTPRQPETSHDDYAPPTGSAMQSELATARDSSLAGQLDGAVRSYGSREEGENGNSDGSYDSGADAPQQGVDSEEEGECFGEEEEGELM
ncbi:hypothetical protein H4218_001304 [Coemansia sp. IMI 209128]|uniref:Uncharacterized protein n=1 Tax=Coemansia linderi TaxID=2663919 RepID=A0ACC1KL89_9FUNG|nr:hypothetical protein GGI10_003227 [Coemansia sp. RSA 2530]KAJ2701592.1 hypothetical protein H4218_001304 [Coemansia sp. IMI 209128]KAJ2791612.1 hypothetical protein GGI18_001008 [Coemansia linderi]